MLLVKEAKNLPMSKGGTLPDPFCKWYVLEDLLRCVKNLKMSNIFDNSWEPKVSLSVTCRTILVFMCNHKSDCLSCCHISHVIFQMPDLIKDTYLFLCRTSLLDHSHKYIFLIFQNPQSRFGVTQTLLLLMTRHYLLMQNLSGSQILCHILVTQLGQSSSFKLEGTK